MRMVEDVAQAQGEKRVAAFVGLEGAAVIVQSKKRRRFRLHKGVDMRWVRGRVPRKSDPKSDRSASSRFRRFVPEILSAGYNANPR